MQRRDFLKLAALTGLTFANPFGRLNSARAEEIGNYDGPLFITINASGGWDPTMVCDPKGQETGINQGFTKDEIVKTGPFSVAPIPFISSFFDQYKSDLMVINGIDVSTNNHSPGMRNIWSGMLGEGHPNFAALVAGCTAPDAPMAFVADGGYEETAGLVTITRAESANLDFIKRIANPNYVSADGDMTYHDDDIANEIRKARMSRLNAQRTGSTLPRVKQSMDKLYKARVGQKQLKNLIKHLENPTGGNKLIRQAKLTLAAYEAGLTVGAHLTSGGFDTHNDHDNRQTNALANLFQGLQFLFDEVEARGLSENVIIAVSSEFARTPGYNGGNGKDHWPYTSMFLYGPSRIPGGRLIGLTDDGQNGLRINPAIPDEADENGVRVEPAHIHQYLRQVAKIENHPLSNQFQLNPSATIDFGA